MSKVIYGEIYLGIEDQPDGDVWGINQIGLKNIFGVNLFVNKLKEQEVDESVPSSRGAFGRLSPPNKAPSPPRLKHKTL